MSAELLREAANRLRIDAVVSYERDRDARVLGFNRAVADWLDAMAARAESKIARGGDTGAVWSHERHALAVARACLGRTS